MNASLQTRLLITASIVLVFFFGVTGLALDKAFRDSAESAVRERLQTQLYVLLAAAELDEDIMLFMPDQLPEPRFSVAQSGLYAQIINKDGKQIWHSRSLIGTDFPTTSEVGVGQSKFFRSQLDDGTPLFVFDYGISWQSGDSQQRYTFYVATHLDSYHAQIAQFRRSLSVWLAAAALVLLALQGTILRWSLHPLRQAEKDVAAIESGEATELSGRYPKELQGLTSNLNQLMHNSRQQLKRYRDSLGNLAHSLKTPLSVIRNITETESDIDTIRETTQEQVERMTQSIDYQLNRAATSGVAVLNAPVALAPIIDKIIGALKKANHRRDIEVSLRIETGTRFYGNEDDLYELLGNLLENAFKWSDSLVRVNAYNVSAIGTARKRLKLVVEDDGPGINQSDRNSILHRGMRADEKVPGHGIGLSIVVDIIELYGGEISIGDSTLGGAAIEISV